MDNSNKTGLNKPYVANDKPYDANKNKGTTKNRERIKISDETTPTSRVSRGVPAVGKIWKKLLSDIGKAVYHLSGKPGDAFRTIKSKVKELHKVHIKNADQKAGKHLENAIDYFDKGTKEKEGVKGKGMLHRDNIQRSFDKNPQLSSINPRNIDTSLKSAIKDIKEMLPFFKKEDQKIIKEGVEDIESSDEYTSESEEYASENEESSENEEFSDDELGLR